MKNKVLLTLMFCSFAVCVSAQTPEDVVQEYVRLLNDWLASPTAMQKREKVADILTPTQKKCLMKDEIVEKYNSDAGSMETNLNGYLTIFSEKAKQQKVSVEILNLSNTSTKNITIATAILKYSGGISITTATDFWIFNHKIGYIVTNDQERYKLKNDIADNLTDDSTESNTTNAQKYSEQNILINNTEKHKIITVSGVSFKMIYIPSGTFQMGATEEQSKYAFNDENPVHSVTLRDYYIGETEVTQELWQAVMENNPSIKKGEKYPVDNVTWNECQEFIKKLNQETGLLFRLPTEAEWEYAARGGNKSHDFIYSGSNKPDDIAVYKTNENDHTSFGMQNVKSKKPNELGLYDMSGNVWEWCEDKVGYYSPNSIANPIFLESGSSERIMRGGSWKFGAKECRVSYRGNYYPSTHRDDNGVRLVMNPN